jgi:hypothetical protein
MRNIYSILKKQKYLLLLFVTGFLHLWFIYGHVLQNPNAVLSVSDGDGLKNYYAYITEISEQGAVNQLSFNYPYGESYLFTDCHPFLARSLHYISKICPGTEHYSIGIVNMLMIVSLLFTYLVLFLLLRRFIKTEWYALLWAFAIMLLQPQLDRMGGHLSLSYSLAIPLCFYWIVLYYQSNKKILYGVLLLLSNLFWLGTHTYLGVITCGFTFLFDVYQYVSKNEYRNKKDVILAFVKSVVPLVSFLIYLSILDIHTGRTTNPWGFFAYRSSLTTIFFPYCGWLARLLQKTFHYRIEWEGIAYVGLISTICFVILVLFAVKRLYTRYIKKRIGQKFPVELGLFAPALFASIICLWFSMGYPFRLGLEFLLDYLSFIKNFRSTGRFSWAFFYVITTLSAYIIYQYAQIKLHNKKKFFACLLLIIPPLFTIMEGIPYQKSVHENIFRSKNLFLVQNLDSEYQKALKNINSDEYQAVIPLPFYQGSENFSKDASNHHIYGISNLFAYHLKLPLMAARLARTSIWESRNLIQVFAPEYYQKLIADDIPSKKKFLLVCLSENNALTEYEQDFLKKAVFLFKANEVEFWEITYEKLTETVSAPYIADFNQKRDSLISQDAYLLSQADSTVFLFSFDAISSEYHFLGNGAYEQPEKEKYSIFSEIEPHKLNENRTYEVSFWFYVGGKNYGQDKLGWTISAYQIDTNSEERFSLFEARGMDRDVPVVLGEWALASYRFTIQNTSFPTRFVISKTKCKGYQTTIDEFLIRPVDVDVYRVLEEDNLGIQKLYKNGQIIERTIWKK